MTVYTFDVLPVHPHPHRLESFTSYLARLGELNGIRYPQTMLRLLFPDLRLQVSSKMLDTPFRTLSDMPVATQCQESTLLATTFHHLLYKFDRVGSHQFLTGSLAKTLRYCPRCLAETRYYRLTWRFETLSGCALHNCRLLDRCGRCGLPVPLLSAPLRVGFCPFCGGDLSNDQSPAMDSTMREVTQRCDRDLCYLLSPQEWELQDTSVRESLGPWLSVMRRQQVKYTRKLARTLRVSKQVIQGLEYPRPKRRGAPLRIYLVYGDYLNLSWQEVFETLVREYSDVACDVDVFWAETLRKRTEQAIQTLVDRKHSVNQKSVSRVVGMKAFSLKQYPEVRDLLETVVDGEYEEHLRQHREAQLLEKTRLAVRQLERQGQEVTPDNIAAIVGLLSGSLRRYPTVKRYLSQVAGRDYEKQLFRQRDQWLLNRAPTVIQELRSVGKRVSFQNVSSGLGFSDGSALCRHPALAALVKQAGIEDRERRRQNREEVLLQQVREAVWQLEARGDPLMQKDVVALTGKSLSGLWAYPRVRALLKEITRR